MKKITILATNYAVNISSETRTNLDDFAYVRLRGFDDTEDQATLHVVDESRRERVLNMCNELSEVMFEHMKES